MTMTFAEADRIIEHITLVLANGPHPNLAEIAAWKHHERRLMSRICWGKYRRYLPKPLLKAMERMVGTATEAGERAKKKVIQSDPIFSKHKPVQIDAALKIGVACMYLGLVKGTVSQQHFSEYVNASSPMLLALQGWFEVFVPGTTEMTPEFGAIETAESFASFCRRIGATDTEYWRKVYDRIGQEFTADCPQGNCLP